MKAPDKIYISVERIYNASDGQVIAMVTPHNERQSTNDIEYIRKGALLEWAEEEMMKAAKQSDAYGRRNAFMDVIDKINSL